MAGAGGAQPSHATGRRSPSRRRGTYWRFLGFSALGSLVPGIGLVAAGRRTAGWLIFGAWLGVVGGVVVAMVRMGTSGLLTLSSDPSAVQVVGVAAAAGAAAWLLVAIVSFHLLQPAGMSGGRRLAGAVVVICVTSLVVGPLAFAVRYSTAHNELIDTVFATEEHRSLTGPTAEPNVRDPWAGESRVTVLLLGSDSAEGRDGVRPDTQIVASVDTATGHTVLLSLPRNLERVPFPEDSPLRELYPHGYDGPGDRLEWMLNAIYQNVPATHPDVFTDSDYPGADANKWAVEGALGIDVDYFVMVNLDGFEQIVDALGGITIDVSYRIPIGTRYDEQTGRCTEPRDWIEPGPEKHLDGGRALWYARARCGPPPVSDDFNRMERQRCVIGAIIREANPVNLLRHYERLAGAARDLFVTDIPQSLLPAFVDLALRVKDAPVESLAFTDDVLASRSNPDFDRMRELAAEAIAAPPGPAFQDDEGVPDAADAELEPPSGTDQPGGNAGGSGAGETDVDGSDSGSGGPDDTAPVEAQPLEAVC